jgi:GT2 family glycosyltransferase
MKKVSIVIPTRQLKRDKNFRFFYRPVTSLPQLLEDIKNNITIDYEVIVIVNGINDSDLLKYVEGNELIDKYSIINQNIGVSRAWNVGAMLAESEAIVFINDDVRVGKNSVDTMYDYLVDNINIGEIGPKGGLWHRDIPGERKGIDSIEEVDEISGFCFMTTREVFDKVGGFDISYTPAGFEEIDYSFKVRKHGFKCVVLPSLDITTEPNHGISARNEDIIYFNTKINTKKLHKRNKSYFLKKWYN